jgi:hypothetical protein
VNGKSQIQREILYLNLLAAETDKSESLRRTSATEGHGVRGKWAESILAALVFSPEI